MNYWWPFPIKKGPLNEPQWTDLKREIVLHEIVKGQTF